MRKTNIEKWALLSAIVLLVYFAWKIPYPPLAWAATSGRPIHVTGQAITGSLAYPACLEGGTTQRDMDVGMIIIANTDASAHTITIEDGQGSPFIFFSAYPIAAKTTWIISLGGTRFRGGLRWTSDSTTVQGSVIASY
jgi:hypothetical protein